MHFWTSILIISYFIIFFNYIGYALIVYIINRLSSKSHPAVSSAGKQPFYDTVSFIVAAYNEEDCIKAKLENSFEQEYPRDKIEYIFITDGSTDRTNDIIRNYPQVKLLYLPARNGKSAALNRAVNAASNNILIFSDANTVLNRSAVYNIVRHYEDSKVGGVAGEKRVTASGTGEVVANEGLYWKYESFLKKLDSDFFSVVGAAGELFSIRRILYEPLSHDIILDDFVVSLKAAQKGYRIIYEPEANASELPSSSIEDESKRKIRIAAGGFQAIVLLHPLLRFWKYPRLSFLYISHRLLRWTLTPLSLITGYLSSMLLFFISDYWALKALFILHTIFYISIILYSMFPVKNKFMKPLQVAYYFIFMNISVIKGFFRFIKGSQPAAWEKAKRTSIELNK